MNNWTRTIVSTTLMVILFICLATPGFAGIYWVSPTGSAPWANCQSTTDPGSGYCHLSRANSNAQAGDIVYLKGGTYANVGIAPSYSGSSGNVITFQACTGETPTITGTSDTSFHAIDLTSRSYIKVSGIKVTNVSRLAILRRGGYNEIAYCTFERPVTNIFHIGFTESSDTSTNNWVHHNVFRNVGAVYNCAGGCCASADAIQVGMYGYDGTSGNNTIENNTFHSSAHAGLETFTRYNVIKNNFFHNESWMDPNSTCTAAYPPSSNGKYGHRNIIIDWWSGTLQTPTYNLVEGNRFGHAGQPPDNDGGESLSLSSFKNIVRNNAIYGSTNVGVYFKSTGPGETGSYNRFYNNTIYRSGYGDPCPDLGGACSGLTTVDLVNGKYYQVAANIRFNAAAIGNVLKNNLLHDGRRGDWGSSTTGQVISNNWLAANGDPLFINTDTSDPTSISLPNLSLQSSSTAIDGGTHLTQASGSGSSSTNLIVNDALYFQDGTLGSALARGVTHFADWIAIGTVGNVVQISSVNYDTNTITLASPMTWSNGASVWLYKKSDGTTVLNGSAPDYGAYEFGQSQSPSSPKNLRVQ